MTFSIAARCEKTGMFGAVVSSSSACVAARCAYARAGVGAVLTQNITDPRLGPRGLDLMEGGKDARAALDEIIADAPHIAYRQLGIVDSDGKTAGFSGDKTLGIYTIAQGPNVIAAGNLLANEGVPQAMVGGFDSNRDAELGARLLRALEAGVAAGGEAGPVFSAGLVLVDREAWPIADLRVDWDERDPVVALRELWALWRPQMHDYVTRCLDPATAPAYGVPGNE